MKMWFVGPQGLRSGWRFLIFLALQILLAQIVQAILFGMLKYKEPELWTAGSFVILESAFFITAFGAVWLVRFVERKRWTFADYGTPFRSLFGAHFWQGLLWGFLAPTLLVLMIAGGGGASFRGFALHGSELAYYTVMWLIAMTLLGLSEEFVFRGYALFTLSEGMGFWPATAVLSLIFGALHYFTKPMETWMDGLSVTLIGAFLCLTIRRTGTLWFAVGFHAAFDFAAMSLYAAPNTGNKGQSVVGHLLDVAYSGPSWMTGGVCGIEASALIFPVIALLFYAFHRLYPDSRYPRSAVAPASGNASELLIH